MLRKGFIFYKYYDFYWGEWSSYLICKPKSRFYRTRNTKELKDIINSKLKTEIVYKVTKRFNKALIQEI